MKKKKMLLAGLLGFGAAAYADTASLAICRVLAAT